MWHRSNHMQTIAPRQITMLTPHHLILYGRMLCIGLLAIED